MISLNGKLIGLMLVLVLNFAAYAGHAAENAKSFLETNHRRVTLTSSIPENGDQNPYAIIAAPVSAGIIQKDDVLVDNFNNSGNLQGTGTTIVDFRPSTKTTTLFAQVPRDLKGCPGGIGLSTAMTMLKSGWIIVGSAPSTDGTTATKGPGCLIVIDSHGKVQSTIAGADINDPWGNMAVIDNGTSAIVFVSNTGFGVGAPLDERTVVNKATVLRIELSIPKGKPPAVKSRIVIASGLSERAARDVFIIGPTGLALGPDNATLYVSDALNNRVVAIDNAVSRKDSAGAGREVTKDGLLQRPLAMVMGPNGNLLVVNGRNGQVVEVDPATGKQLYAQWIDTDKAQNPPGSGDLFGIAVKPDGKGFYYVEDDTNTVVLSE